MTQLIECVPNFSEGRDRARLTIITDAIDAVEGVTVLDVDPGAATNRTVVTFVGGPDAIVEGAVRAGLAAKDAIDMRAHSGEHPRFGAMDVCPLVPIAGITMDEVVTLAHRIGERLGREAGISGYYYEHAATDPARRNLAACRAGEYEGLPAKLADPAWRPDFGPGTFDPKYGVTAVGARDFLVAYNVNLNTTSARRANAIAFDVREKGRVSLVDGAPALDANGHEIWLPGSLKGVKAIGWFIEEYGIAQISMNLTSIIVTPIHVAFDECCRRAEARGIRVTGSEIVGLVPLSAMLEAGRHFLRKQQRSLGIPDEDLIAIAVTSLGLDELKPFEPTAKIIEYAVQARAPRRRLVDLSLRGFVHRTASEAPAPGGGSVAAALGALAAALATMVANLSAHKRGWDDRWEEFSRWAERGKALHDALLELVDADTDAFNAIAEARRLPRATEAERAVRDRAVQDATKGAIEIPLRVMRCSMDAFPVIRAMAEHGLPASVSDAGVGALVARAAVEGAHLNVRVNATDITDRSWVEDVLATAQSLRDAAQVAERDILALIDRRL